MVAPEYNFCINQGDDFILTLTVKGDNGVPFNLTGYSFDSQARENISSVSPAFSFSFVINPDQIANAGKVQMILTNAQTAAIALNGFEGKFIYDVEMTDADSLKSKIMRGEIKVIAEITK